MVVPSLSRILDLSTSIRSLSIWYDSRQAFSSQPTCGLIARTAICASECLRVCRRMSILSITTHILYVPLSMCAQKQTYTCLFSSGKGNAKERREASLSVSLSLSLARFYPCRDRGRTEFISLRLSYFREFLRVSRKEKNDITISIVEGISFFKFQVSSFFFFFPIYYIQRVRTYFKSFHICHRSTTHVHIRSMSYTARAIYIFYTYTKLDNCVLSILFFRNSCFEFFDR